MTKTRGSGIPLDWREVAAVAREEARQAIERMVVELGGRTVSYLGTTAITWPGFNNIDPEPIAQIEAAHAVEQAAHSLIKDYLQLARQAGRTWYEIGDGLDLHWQASAAKESISEIAYSTALDYRMTDGERIFTWNCPACQRLITDHNPFWDEPPAREEGHADDCPRWAAELAEWQRHKCLEESRARSRSAASHTEPTEVTKSGPSYGGNQMDEYEIAQRSSKLPDLFASRVSEETLEGLRLMEEGGEYGELTSQLAAAIAQTAAPVTATEQQELRALLEATHMPTDPIEHLNVVQSAR